MKHNKTLLIIFVISQFSAWIYRWFFLVQNLHLFTLFQLIYALSQSAIYFIFFLALREIMKTSHLSSQSESLKRELELQEKQANDLAVIRENSQLFQNEITRELNSIRTLLAQNQFELAGAKLQDLTTHFNTIRPRPICSDILLNAILQSKHDVASKMNITVNYHILLPENLNFVATVLSSIFFNLLDNGIEACMRSNTNSPFLTLVVKSQANFLHIKMENSKNPAERFDRTTKKSDSSLHGYGLAIIEDIISTHDGLCKWIDNGNTFQSILMIRTDSLSNNKNH